MSASVYAIEILMTVVIGAFAIYVGLSEALLVALCLVGGVLVLLLVRNVDLAESTEVDESDRIKIKRENRMYMLVLITVAVTVAILGMKLGIYPTIVTA